jgi:hypothetical protein
VSKTNGEFRRFRLTASVIAIDCYAPHKRGEPAVWTLTLWVATGLVAWDETRRDVSRTKESHVALRLSCTANMTRETKFSSLRR